MNESIFNDFLMAIGDIAKHKDMNKYRDQGQSQKRFVLITYRSLSRLCTNLVHCWDEKCHCIIFTAA